MGGRRCALPPNPPPAQNFLPSSPWLAFLSWLLFFFDLYFVFLLIPIPICFFLDPPLLSKGVEDVMIARLDRGFSASDRSCFTSHLQAQQVFHQKNET